MPRCMSVRHRVATVGAAADRNSVRPSLAVEELRRRRKARDRILHGQLRHLDAERAAEKPRPDAGRADDGARSDTAMLSHDSGDAPCRVLDAAHGATADDARARARRAAGDRSPRPRRLRAPVARRVERAREALAGGKDVLELAAGDDLRVEPVLARDVEPGSELREILVGLCEVESAALPEADILAKLRRQLLPEPEALHHERQLERCAALLAHPAPVAPRLLAGDAALLEQRDGDTFSREEI